MRRLIVLSFAVLFLVTGCAVDNIPAVDTQIQVVTTDPVVPTTLQTAPETTEPMQTTLPIPADDELVCTGMYAPQLRVELAYATAYNFTGKVIYDFEEAYLRYGTLKKLIAADELLRAHGVGIVIWDGFRPVSAQEKLWQVCPDPTYVSHPVTGRRAHCRGNAVDVTLYDLQTGELLDMPTGFDDFSKRADRNYADCTQTQKENALLLENAMKDCGFKPYSAEWWHYTDRVDYPVDEAFDPSVEQ